LSPVGPVLVKNKNHGQIEETKPLLNEKKRANNFKKGPLVPKATVSLFHPKTKPCLRYHYPTSETKSNGCNVKRLNQGDATIHEGVLNCVHCRQTQSHDSN
jgi:hypothetical protein